MSTILGHYTRIGVKVLSKLIPSVSEKQLSSESLKYFERTFILSANSLNFESNENVQCSLSIRQVRKLQYHKRSLCLLFSY